MEIAASGWVRRPFGSGWLHVPVALIAVIAAAPLAVAFSSLLTDTGEIREHLAMHVLPLAATNTLWLAVGVALLTMLLGVSLAWIVAVFEFPGKRIFSWALLLPMAVPGYVLAFAFAALFEYTGPVQQLWRQWFGTDAGFPDIGSRAASIATLGLVLYPYVFMIVREAFASQGRRCLEVARSCGMTPFKGFLRVALPLARPFIVAGVSLAVMESLADFGTVKLYNYTTFTTAIYQSWYGLFSLDSALQLSLVLIVLVLCALWLEKRLRGRAAYTTASAAGEQRPLAISRGTRMLCTVYCSAVLLIGFVLPVAIILRWALQSFSVEFDPRYWSFAANSVTLSAMAASLIAATAVLLAYCVRLAPTRMNRLLSRLATLGYALPGTVLAVGFFVPVAGLSVAINRYLGLEGQATIALQSSLLVIILAYLSRYLAVAHGSVDSALTRIRPQIEDASRGLGVAGWQMLKRVHLPILRPAILTAALLVFVDVMKELPITLMTRPFGWDTLAVRVFQLTTEGEWQRAALPALVIVVAGLAPVILVTRQRDNART